MIIQTVDIRSIQITTNMEFDINGLRPVFFNSGIDDVRIFNSVIPPNGSFILDMGNCIVDARVPIKFLTNNGPKVDIYYGVLKA